MSIVQGARDLTSQARFVSYSFNPRPLPLQRSVLAGYNSAIGYSIVMGRNGDYTATYNVTKGLPMAGKPIMLYGGSNAHL